MASTAPETAGFEDWLDGYAAGAEKQGGLIYILQRAQEAYGYLSDELLERVGEKTGIKPAKILGVATFYSQFKFSKPGKHIIMLCQGTACHVNGSEGIGGAISERLRVKDGETTEDGLFSLQMVACLGCCSLSPVMTVDGEAYGNLTPDSALKILEAIAESEGKE